MFSNIYYDYKQSTIHLWETIKGERFYNEIDWTPYVYVKTSGETQIKSVWGDNVRRKEFSTYWKYRDFCNKASNEIFEDKVKPEIQFLAERYYQFNDDSIENPPLRIGIFDIEVLSDVSEGFPDKNIAQDTIPLISIHDNFDSLTYVFGLFPYTGNYKQIKFHQCKDERDLLKKFFNFCNKTAFDVISGWYIYGFDFPYLYNRCKRLFGDNENPFRKISPINVYSAWEKRDGSDMMFDFAGVSILDYIDIYKKYSGKNLESYKLDYVTKLELEEGKIDYSEYENLDDLYYNDWNKYVEYNVTDVYRIYQLEEKKKIILLIQTLSLLTKCPMKFHDKVTHLIEGYFITYYRRNNLCAPKLKIGEKENYEAAYVKEPNPGFYEWVVDLDITSSYPTAMITLNMSIETYYGRIEGFNSSKIIEYTRKREYPEFILINKEGNSVEIKDKKLKTFNLGLKKGLFVIAPNGVIFTTNKKGVIADVENIVFAKRKEIKNQMLEFDKKISKIKNKEEKEKLKNKRNSLYGLQLSHKNIINSIYGAVSTPYFRLHNLDIAKAITACGRHAIRSGENYANEIMNNPNEELKKEISKIGKLKEKQNQEFFDYNIYIDTDSIFLYIFQLLRDNLENIEDWNKLELKEKENYVISISKVIEKYVNQNSFERLQLQDYNSQEKNFKTEFKQEIVAPSGIFVKKKKYACWITNKEGTEKDELMVKGLELIQSSTPEIIKEYLRDIMKKILQGKPDEEITEKIRTVKKECKEKHPSEIAQNIGVGTINKYFTKDGLKKGATLNAKSVYNYHYLLKYLNIEHKYQKIIEGEKVKIVYINPNKWYLNSVAFTTWPKEFDENGIKCDYDKMIDKFFINKIKMLLTPAGKEEILNEQDNVLSAFF